MEELFRVGLLNFWQDGILGQNSKVAFIDTGLVPEVPFEKNVIEEIDFSLENNTRYKGAIHGSDMVGNMLVVAPCTKVAMFKVSDKYQFPNRKAVIKAIKYCMEVFPKYEIINCNALFDNSKCPEKCDLCETVKQAYETGILIVTPAGNDGMKWGKLKCPSCSGFASPVMSYETDHQREFFSKTHWIKLLYLKYTGKLSQTFGTSFSAAYQTGFASLIKTGIPDLDMKDYKQTVRSLFWRGEEPAPFDEGRGVNVLNMYEVYKLLRTKYT